MIFPLNRTKLDYLWQAVDCVLDLVFRKELYFRYYSSQPITFPGKLLEHKFAKRLLLFNMDIHVML